MMTFKFKLYLTSLLICFTTAATVPSSSNQTDLASEDKARIIGGVPVSPGELRYQLRITYRNLHHCGAALLFVDSLQVAVTAAHCVRHFAPLSPEDVTLVAGDVKLSERSGTEQERPISKIVIHPQFTSNLSLLAFDIALLYFEPPFQFNEFVAPIALPSPGEEVFGGSLVASGWGIYNEDRFISDNLTRVELPIVDLQTCRRAYAAVVKNFFTHFICTATGAKMDSCKGDSGGPLVQNGVLTGIISWGVECGNQLYPGVNTKVSHFTEWIQSEVKKQKGDDPKDEDDSDEDNDR